MPVNQKKDKEAWLDEWVSNLLATLVKGIVSYLTHVPSSYSLADIPDAAETKFTYRDIGVRLSISFLKGESDANR